MRCSDIVDAGRSEATSALADIAGWPLVFGLSAVDDSRYRLFDAAFSADIRHARSRRPPAMSTTSCRYRHRLRDLAIYFATASASLGDCAHFDILDTLFWLNNEALHYGFAICRALPHLPFACGAPLLASSSIEAPMHMFAFVCVAALQHIYMMKHRRYSDIEIYGNIDI